MRCCRKVNFAYIISCSTTVMARYAEWKLCCVYPTPASASSVLTDLFQLPKRMGSFTRWDGG